MSKMKAVARFKDGFKITVEPPKGATKEQLIKRAKKYIPLFDIEIIEE